MKYEFKDIKDVDLSKLEGKERYTCLVGGIATIITGNSLKLGIFKAQTILLPCSPIVEIDKLRDEFEEFEKTIYSDPFSNYPKKIFDFFLSRLSVSKEVEVSDEEIDVEAFVKDWMGGYESDTFVKDKQGIYWYSAGYSSINLALFFEDLLEGFISRDKQGIAPCKEVYKSGDRVEIIKTGDKGTMWIINGRWVNIKLDKGETYKGETDEIRHCQMEFVAPCKVEEKCIEFAEWIKENGWFKLSDQLWQNDWSIGRFTTKELFKQFLKEGETKQ